MGNPLEALDHVALRNDAAALALRGVCAGQALSATTTLESGDDVAVITYGGADDCDCDAETDNALLTVNDEDRGKIGGIVCAVRAPGASASPWVAVSLLGLAAAGLRRRATRAPQQQA